MSGSGEGRAQLRRAWAAERIADHLLAHGLEAASLRPLAKAVGISDRMLIYYFGTRDAAIAAGLSCAAARLHADLEAYEAGPPVTSDALARRLTGFILDEARRPAMTLWMEIAARAARGTAPYDQIAPAIAEGFLDWVMPQIAAPQDQRKAEALRVLAQLDGLAMLAGAGVDLSGL